MSCFNKVAILGPGLLGGSIALAIQKKIPATEVSLWGRKEKVIEQVRQAGFPSATSDLQLAVKGADLIILAVPVGVMPTLVKQLDLSQDVLVTDVGSVKRSVHESLSSLFDGQQASFIGSHPMAGSERAGFSAAHADLLDGAACIITNDGGTHSDKLENLKNFWQQLGLIIRELNAEDHDYAVARISHFPHTMASITATVGLDFEDLADLAGGGMRDTTRVAAGDPSLWTEILMENADALQRSLAECMVHLETVSKILKEKDQATLHNYLTVAKHKRELI